MKKKMILTFVLMILLPVLILVVSIYRGTERAAVNNMIRTMQTTLERSGKDIAGMTDSVEMISNSLFNDSTLKDYIGDKEEKDFKTMISQFSQLRTTIANSESVFDIYRVEVYIDDRKMAAHEYVHFFPLSKASTAQWYQDILQQGGGAWCKGYRNELMLNADGVYLIPYRRILHSGSNIFARDGVLVMNLNETSLYRYLEDIPTRTTERVYLLDGECEVLSAKDKELLGEHLLSEEQEEEILTKRDGSFGLVIDGRNCTAVFDTIPQTGWILLDVIENDYILENYSFWADVKIVFFVVLILTLFAAASFIVIHTFDKEMVRRITKMARNLEQGQAPERATKITESEIDRAERLVYEMIDNNKKLVEENYRAKLEERKVQLFALQAQINPHFLYNTLECINWMAFQRGADEISQAVTMLARYFRLSLNKGREIVSVADEVELARTYLAIQNIRFDSAITVDIDMPESMSEYKIPKLVLQPFVENAVIHGILKKPSRSGIIRIHVTEEENRIAILIEDDGVGIPSGMLQEIFEKDQNDHYGIYNAKSRIRLFYGEEFGVKISSEENKWTRVAITIGKRKEI